MSKRPRLLVLGATGPQQRPVAERLLAEGFPVRLLVRDVAAASALARRGAEVVAGDLGDAASVRRAMAGVEGVSLFVPFMNPRPEFGHHVLDAARAAGVRRIVWNPTGAVPPGKTGHPGMDLRFELQQALASSDFDAVTIEPTAYLENFLMPALVEELKTKHTFAYPMPPTSAMQWVCHDDVAQFVVKAFQTPTLKRATVAVCGPERLTGDDIAERLSRGLGRTIRFRSMPPREFGEVLDRAMGPGTGERVVGFYEGLLAAPERFSSNVDLAAALERLPITPTTVEAWSRKLAALLT